MIRPDPGKIIVPRQHGEVLIEPPLATLAAAIAAPQAPPSAARAAPRKELLDAARRWATQIGAAPPGDETVDQPFIISGHQLEFYHAGVWAKVAAADELARRTGGIAFDILVDHDVVEQMGFDVPEQGPDGKWSRQPILFAPVSPLPAEQLAAPDLPHFEAWDAALAELPAAHSDALAFWLSELRPRRSQRESYVAWLSRARVRFEESMGLRVHHVPASLLCSGPTWHAFVRNWIQNANRWVPAYNAHLADYRRQNHLKNPQFPMPDLAIEHPAHDQEARGTLLELPFWIYGPGEPRQRLMVRIPPDGADPLLLHGPGVHPLSALDDPHRGFVIRPRALTLTMFLRLYFADVFIHGIGGALYDQITDGLLQQLFDASPAYGCVSAAWLLPLGAAPIGDPGTGVGSAGGGGGRGGQWGRRTH